MPARGENTSNYGKPWSSDDDAALARLARLRLGVREIAFRLGRSEQGVYGRADRLKISVASIYYETDERREEALQDMTWSRLASCHGPDRADRIMAGDDPKTNADIQAWRTLGRRTGEAA